MASIASESAEIPTAAEKTLAIVEFFRTAAKEKREIHVQEFQVEAQRVLQISQEDALELAYQMDFEGGIMAVPGSLFCSPPRKRPQNGSTHLKEPAMRTLYYDTLYHYANHELEPSTPQKAPCVSSKDQKHRDGGNGQQNDHQASNSKDEGYNDEAYALAADLWKQSNTYAMDVADFTRIGYQHDLRRSDIHSLLKIFDFIGGLVVNPKGRWFDSNGSMHKKYLNCLVEVCRSEQSAQKTEPGDGTMPPTSNVLPEPGNSIDANELPDWARLDIKSKKKLNLEAPGSAPVKGKRQSRSQYRPTRRNSAPPSMRERAKLHGLNIVTTMGGHSNNDEELKDSDGASPSSPETPDWGSSFAWRRKSRH